jgi:hypothetical protein
MAGSLTTHHVILAIFGGLPEKINLGVEVRGASAYCSLALTQPMLERTANADAGHGRS